MTLKKDSYVVSRAVLEKVLGALSNNRMTGGTACGDEYNNDDVIEAQDTLEAELEKQES